jgi:uncharacterized BrkB/YihY/UPF0761 family membrane protein
MLPSVSILEDRNIINSIGRSFKLIKGNIQRVLGLYLILLIVGFIFLLVLSSPFIVLLIEALNMFTDIADKGFNYISDGIFLFCAIAVVGFIISILSVGQGLLFYTLVEIVEAKTLRKMIARIGGTNADDV